MVAQVNESVAVLPHGAVRAALHHHPPMEFSEMPVPPPAFMGSEGLHLRTEGADILQLVPLGSIRVPYPSCRYLVNGGFHPGETSS